MLATMLCGHMTSSNVCLSEQRVSQADVSHKCPIKGRYKKRMKNELSLLIGQLGIGAEDPSLIVDLKRSSLLTIIAVHICYGNSKLYVKIEQIVRLYSENNNYNNNYTFVLLN